MKEVLDKISSYNLFNYLLPGTLFVILLDKITVYSFLQKDIIVGAFVYYFIGSVVSRFGSLVVGPILKKVSFLKFSHYKEYVSASKIDLKIDVLSETNNMYRTFIAMIILLMLLKIYEQIDLKFPALKDWNPYILMFLLLIMFLYAYRKQTEFITKRIKANQD